MSDLVKAILCVLGAMAVSFLLSVTPAKADDYLTYTCCSWHAENHNLGKKDKHFQETNHGIGWEHEFSKTYSFAMGEYSNSLYNHSDYAGIFWYPYYYGNWKFGSFLGGISGYPKENSVGPIVVPTISYERKWWGVNLETEMVPPVTQHLYSFDRTHAIFALQFKIQWREL